MRPKLPPPPTSPKPFAKHVRTAQRGRLASSKLFDKVSRVFLLHNAGWPESSGGPEADADQVLELATANSEMAGWLFGLVVGGHGDKLREVADIVDFLCEPARKGERYAPHRRDQLDLLRYAAEHDTSKMTRRQLYAWFTERHAMERRTFERLLKRLGIPWRAAKSGPQASSQELRTIV